MENNENECSFKGNPIMEAVSMFLQVISRSNMNEKDKVRICGKLSESFSYSPKEMEVLTWQREERSFEAEKGHEDSSENEKIKVTKGENDAERETKERFFLALTKAVEDGVLQVKDVQTTTKNLHSSFLEGRTEKEKRERNGKNDIEDSNKLSIGVEMASGDWKEEGSSNGGVSCQGPSVNNQADINRLVVFKGATAPRQGDTCPSSGSPCKSTFSHVNQQKENSCSTFQADDNDAQVGNVSLAQVLKLFPDFVKLYSKGSSNGEENFQEPSDKGFKGATGSPCKKSISHVIQQKDIAFSSIPAVELADIPLKEDFTPFSDKAFQKEKFSTNVFMKKATDLERENTSHSSFLPKATDFEKEKFFPSSSLPNAHSLALTKQSDGQKQTKVPTPLSYADVISANGNLKNSAPPRSHDHAVNLEEEGGSLVKVPFETIKRRLELCKLSVIGRVILGKGEEVWPTKKLRERLNEVWGFNSSWRLISLGKGYFHLLLSSQDEFDKVWKRGVISLKPGVLRIQKFIFGVDPTKEKTTHAQVWFRFFNLPWCLWDSSILAALARKIGTPIRFDNNTLNGDFGHYARVLIEVDLSKSIKSDLHLDCGNYIFDIKVTPENLPRFCKACSNIGHSSMECRMLMKKGDSDHSHNNGKLEESNEKHNESKNSRQTEFAIENRLVIHRNRNKALTFQPSQELGDSSKGNHKDKGFEEFVPIFGNQSLGVPLIQDSRDIQTSNKFAVLEEEHESDMENENKTDRNGGIDKEERVTQSGDDVNHKLNDIRKWAEEEKRNMLQPDEAKKQIRNILFLDEAKKQWGDMVDEEEEEEPCTGKHSSSIPREDDSLFYERNGELAELQLSTGIVRFSPIPKKKNEGK